MSVSPQAPTVAHAIADSGALDAMRHLLDLESAAVVNGTLNTAAALSGYDEPLTPLGIAICKGHVEVREREGVVPVETTERSIAEGVVPVFERFPRLRHDRISRQ
jgi:hypothetical protein